MSTDLLWPPAIQLSDLLPPGTRLTDEELIRFSRQNRPHRFERNKDGDITMMSPVGGLGSHHEGIVAGPLIVWAQDTGRGVAFAPNVGFNLPDGSCLAPDAAWLTMPRWKALTFDQQKGIPPLCPEFIVEVRSHSDTRHSVEEKMKLWMDNGAQLAWLIDPIQPRVTILRAGQPEEELVRPEVLQGDGPIEGFVLKAEPLWEGT
jgi:Uma2 family endonuclease